MLFVDKRTRQKCVGYQSLGLAWAGSKKVDKQAKRSHMSTCQQLGKAVSWATCQSLSREIIQSSFRSETCVRPPDFCNNHPLRKKGVDLVKSGTISGRLDVVWRVYSQIKQNPCRNFESQKLDFESGEVGF